MNSLKKNDALQIELIIIKNIYINLAYLKTLFIRIYKDIPEKTLLWQPRYLFLEDTFSFKNNLIRLPFKELNTILFGDGFKFYAYQQMYFIGFSKNKKTENLSINKKNL